MSLNILVLHNIEDLSRARKSALDHVLAFQRYAPDHRYTVRPVSWPVNDALKSFPWDAVIFTSTALGIVTYRPRELFEERLSDWSFLADHTAVKIVFPQDDADHGALLDRFFEAIRADYVFTVRPEFADLIYPKTLKFAKFESTFAGYLNDEDIERIPLFAREFHSREVTIGQRVTLYPPVGGRLARLKGEAALAMKAAAIDRKISEDISVDPRNVFLGDDWYRFLGNCKFVIGAEGGLGVWDPEGKINDAVRHYTEQHPSASFEQIEEACFKGLDGNPEFPGFSPRILEAALLGCCQILVEGSYRGVLKPFEHYIPLKRDFSNFREVFAHMKDDDLVERLIRNCSRDLVETDRFRYRTLVGRVISAIAQHDVVRSESAFSELSFEERFPIRELTRQAWSVGFTWPGISDHVVSKIAAQQHSEVTGYLVPNEVLSQTSFRVYQALVQIISDSDMNIQGRELASTLLVVGVNKERALFVDLLLSEPRLSELSRFTEAAVYAPEVAGLVSRITPKSGERFEGAELLRLQKIDELLVRTAEIGLEPVFRYLAHGESAERLLKALDEGGNRSQLLMALSASPPSISPLVDRLTPRGGSSFSDAEIASLQRLQSFLNGRLGRLINRVLGLIGRNWAPLNPHVPEGG